MKGFGYPDQPPSGRFRIHRKKYKGREASLYRVVNYKIIVQKLNNKVKVCGIIL
jgi:hypothetical protein